MDNTSVNRDQTLVNAAALAIQLAALTDPDGPEEGFPGDKRILIDKLGPLMRRDGLLIGPTVEAEIVRLTGNPELDAPGIATYRQWVVDAQVRLNRYWTDLIGLLNPPQLAVTTGDGWVRCSITFNPPDIDPQILFASAESLTRRRDEADPAAVKALEPQGLGILLLANLYELLAMC